MTLQIRSNREGVHWFVLLSANNKVLMTSETYASKRNCMRAAERVAYHSQFHILIKTNSK